MANKASVLFKFPARRASNTALLLWSAMTGRPMLGVSTTKGSWARYPEALSGCTIAQSYSLFQHRLSCPMKFKLRRWCVAPSTTLASLQMGVYLHGAAAPMADWGTRSMKALSTCTKRRTLSALRLFSSALSTSRALTTQCSASLDR